MQKTFIVFIKAVSRKWVWLVTGVVGGGIFAINLLGIEPTISRVIGIGVLVGCLLIACYLTYHDLYVTSEKAKANISTQTVALRPKRRLQSDEELVFDNLNDLVISLHGYDDANAIRLELLKNVEPKVIINGICTICGKPRIERGDGYAHLWR